MTRCHSLLVAVFISVSVMTLFECGRLTRIVLQNVGVYGVVSHAIV
jgi:hypothetical protein